MRRLGYKVMGCSVAMAILGLLVAIPFSDIPGNPHLFRMMLEGYRIHLIRYAGAANGYLINMSSGDWLLVCFGVFITGFVIAALGHVRRT